MPRAIPSGIRQEIVRRHLDGQTLSHSQFAIDFHLPFGTTHALGRDFRLALWRGPDAGAGPSRPGGLGSVR